MSEQTLKVLRTRNDIACVLINPLQGLHPNSDASSDASLISNGRSAKFDRAAYSAWLQKIRKVCDERGIVLIFDEVFTGFRLAYRGAQEFYNVQADIVTYGKTLGGGLPVGVVCGRAELMKRYRDNRPVDVSFARGTFNSHPMVIASMHEFLTRIEEQEYQEMYQQSEAVWNRRAEQLNHRFEEAGLPLRVENLMSIWTLIYTQPSRYHWMYQFYLRLAGLTLSWVGTGRFIFSHNYSDDDFEQVCERFIEAGEKMKLDGWWWIGPELTDKSIKRRMTHDMIIARFPWMKKILKRQEPACSLGNEAESA
jgi:glutamate-1-semialdehyde 2,1-aminomutase